MKPKLKNPHHIQRKPILAFGEAQTEKAFLRYIKATYGRNREVAITVDCFNGGSPNSIIESAIRHCLQTSYDRCFILLDTDLTWNQEVKNKAKTHKITLLQQLPV